jgi:hypothetical protein
VYSSQGNGPLRIGLTSTDSLQDELITVCCRLLEYNAVWSDVSKEPITSIEVAAFSTIAMKNLSSCTID